MTNRSAPLNQCLKYLRALQEYRWLWIVPAVVFTLAAIFYASVKSTTWQASQAFVVRDEASGGLTHQGRFDSIDAMKSFQETILELARNRSAVEGALKSLDRPANLSESAAWPSTDLIEQVQDSIRVSAPRGAEFGKTEVLYLSVNGPTKQDALQRTEAVYKQLETRLADLRNAKASSLAVETTDKFSLAQRELDDATRRLEDMEREVGSDLGELRILNDSGSGDSNLRASLNQLKSELRQARAAIEANEQQERMLIAANDDPENLLATSSRLYDAQPTLRKLNEGLLDAQLRSAELQGKMTPEHPLVKAALHTEAQVRRDFYAELAATLRGVQADLELNRKIAESLQKQHDATQERLLHLAAMRARYGNLVAEVRQRSELVERAQQDLASARASQSAAESSSLITRFDTPIVGNSPIGPSRSMIVAAGLFGGLLTGAGLVFLAMPTDDGRSRRWTDYIGYGRRSSDRQGDRRGSGAPTSAPAGNRRASDASPRGRRASDWAATNSAPQQVAPQDDTQAPSEQVATATSQGEINVELPATPLPAEEVPSQPSEPEPEPIAAPIRAESTNQTPLPAQLGNPGKRGEGKRSLLAACLSELEHCQQ